MKKNLVLILTFVLVMMCALASCQKQCEHTFSEEWYSDATSHWHPATCEHGEIKDSLENHIDADEDGKCDVCLNDIGHDHSFETQWTFDESNHWKAATCTHTDIKGENGLHVDEDNDGNCDVCQGHVHNVNPAGYCAHTDCGKKVKDIDETSLDEIVNAVYFQNYLVNGGYVDYLFTGVSNTDPMYNATKNDLMTYVYGKDNYTYAKVETTTVNGGVERTGVVQTWHQLKGTDSTFGVAKENEGAVVLDIPDVDRLCGPYISLSTLSGEYGVIETLYALYQAASDNLESGSLIGDVEVNIDTEQNKVIFNYDYKTIFLNASDIAVGEMAGQTVYNVNYFEVEVSFSYNDDFALTELWMTCDCYTNDPGTSEVHGFLYDDVDIEYNPETDSFRFVKYDHETGTYVDTDERTPDTYTIHATQTVGERTEENPYPQSKFVPTGFDIFLTKEPIFDEEGIENGYTLSDKYNGKITASVGDVIQFYISNYTPTGSSLHFIAEQVSFKLYRNDELVLNPEDYLNETAVAMFTFSGNLRLFFVVPKVDGAYKLEIYVLGEKMAETEMNVGAVDDKYVDYDKNTQFVAKVTDSYSWTDEVSFTATKAGTYTFVLPKGVGAFNADGYDWLIENGAYDVNGNPIIDPKDENGNPIIINPYVDYTSNTDEAGKSFSVVLAEGETIRFYFGATKTGSYVISFYRF